MIDHEEILDAIKSRQTWEERQAVWYKMRHDGIRRVNKPFPGASDMHFPLGDMLVEKLKPFYLSQLYAGDTIASFLGRARDAMAMQNEAALWFDHQLKQESNFEDQIAIGVDKMLNCAVVPMKVYWDADRERLAFRAINPIHLIVPPHTGRLAEADWVVHVQHYSKHAYKRLKHFDQTLETIAAICAGESGTAENNSYENAKLEREGITKTSTKGQIVVWEVYSRDDAGKWRVRTYSPAAPTKPLRPDFGLPYNRGVFGDALPPPPFFEITAERKDEGYYDPRGIVERIAPFEASLCRDWNTKQDYQTLTCNPVFSAKNGIGQTTGTPTNLRMTPGQIMPFELQAVAMPPAPVDITQSMTGTRSVAEQLIGAPDFGTQQQGKDNKTAKEVSLIASVMGQATDMRSRNFRRELGHGLRMAWAICQQYRAARREYRTLEGFAEVRAEVFGRDYVIELNASGDNWNRTMVIQKAQAMFQMFKGDPFIDQFELRRRLLNADDPHAAKSLLINQGSQAAAQLEDQAQEISIMLIGYPAEVRETDDDVAHLQCIAGFMQRRGAGVPPDALVLLAQHVTTHAAKLQQTQPERWKQMAPQITPFLQQMQAAGQRAAQAVQAAAMAQGQPQALPPGAPASAFPNPGLAAA